MNTYADTDVCGFTDDEVIELERQALALEGDIFHETGRNYEISVMVEDEYSYIVLVLDWNVAEGADPIHWRYADLDTAERELKIIAGYPA